MTYRLKTYGKPANIKITLEGSSDIHILGFDPEVNKRIYFNRYAHPQGVENIEFGVPVTGKFIDIKIDCKENFRVIEIKKSKLKTYPIITDKRTFDFLNFAQQFAFVCGNKNIGFYTDRDKFFKTQILPDILITPCRIDENTDLIEVSKRAFDEITVSGRVLLMCHEYAHNFLNSDPDNEFEADKKAVQIYLSLGYPVMESIYVFSNFTPTKFNYERIKHVKKILNQHETKILFK